MAAYLPWFDEDDLARVRTRIYDAIGDLDQARGALLAAARRLNAAHAAICIPTLEPELGYFHDCLATDFDTGRSQQFACESGTLDPWTAGFLDKFRVRPGHILIGNQMAPRAAVLKSPWRSDVHLPCDLGDLMLATLRPVESSGAPIAMLGFFRSIRSPLFEPEAAERLSLFVGDLERMLRVALTLRAQAHEIALVRAAIDRAPDAVFVLRADCTILFKNAAAAALLTRNEATTTQRKLVALGEPPETQLAGAVARAAAHAEGSDLLIARPGRSALLVTIAPAPRVFLDEFPAGAGVIVSIVDPDRFFPDASTIARVLALADEDALLVHEIQRGASLADIATRRDVPQSVVNRRFESVLSKLGARSQADLLRMLCGLRSH